MTAITSNGTGGGNWSATASWTGATVPIEGDTVIIQNGDTITIDQDITVGADTTTAAIDVASGGKLEVLSTVAASYTLTCKGDLKTSIGGTIEFGTVANPIPSTRTFTVKLNYSAVLAEGKYGFINNGDMVLQGASKTPHTLLTSDLSATGTVWTVGDTTNWAAGDKVAIASTTRTYSQHEQEVIQTVDSGTQITCVAGVTYAHSGTSPTQAEVINLTRNIVITSYNTSYRSYVYCVLGSTSNVDYVEFYMIGYNATYKHGIEIRTTVADATNFAYCSMWGHATSNYSFYLYIAENVTVDNCVVYNTDEEFYMYNSVDNIITNNIIIGIADGYGLYSNRTTNIFTGNTFTSNQQSGIYINSSLPISTFSNNTAHSNRVYGIYFTSIKGGTISNITSWRNYNYGMYLSYGGFAVNNITAFGNRNANILVSSFSIPSASNWAINGDTSFSTTYGLQVSGVCPCKGVSDAIFGEASGILTTHSSGDIYFPTGTYLEIVFINSKLESSNKVYNIENALIGSYVQCEDFGQVTYADKAWYKNGIVVRDSSTKKYASYATRFDYQANNAAWFEYETYIPVKDGEQIVASAWLRKNASYTDANRPKITLSGQGITEDSDQMSDVTDTWERVTVSGIPTRTGLARLRISTYLVNAGASAWVDFHKTDILCGVLNTIEGDFWANGHISDVFMDTGSITASEFWETLTADVDTAGSFAALFKDYIDAAISSRATAAICTETRLAELDSGNIPADLDNVWMASSTTFARLTAARAGYLDNLSAGAVALESTAQSINDEVGGKWEITGNQMIFYKSDNSTEIMRFNLFNADGNPAVDNVYKRERVP